MNLEIIVLAFIASLPPTIAAISSLVVSIRGNRKVDVVHDIVNGNTSHLIREVDMLKSELRNIKERNILNSASRL